MSKNSVDRDQERTDMWSLAIPQEYGIDVYMTEQIYKLEGEAQLSDVLKSIAKKYGDYIKKKGR